MALSPYRAKFERQGVELTRRYLIRGIADEDETIDAQAWLAEQQRMNLRKEKWRYWWMLGFTIIAAVTGSIAASPIIKDWFRWLLTMRPTGLGSGIDKDRPDYTVVTGEWEVGRIYQTRGGPHSLRWFWSLIVNGPMTRPDRVATLDEAKAQFQKSWDERKAWAKLEEAE
jgi:hypothetical protein